MEAKGEVTTSVRIASRWLHDQVKHKNPAILFQKMSELSTQAGADENADDRILLYCLYLKVGEAIDSFVANGSKILFCV